MTGYEAYLIETNEMFNMREQEEKDLHGILHDGMLDFN